MDLNSSKKILSTFTGLETHYNCRNNKYVTTNFTFQRFNVPDDKVAWSTNYSWYFPLYFTEYHDEPWVDKFVKQFQGPDLPQPIYNSMDGLINRVSYNGPYHVSKTGFPYNPIGRTGICGRGVLGRWGPNHAVMVFVTRWARKNDNINGHIILNCDTGKPMLQFIGLLYRIRGDLLWTVPGGFIDPGESADDAAKREFLEEAFDYKDEEKTELERKMLIKLVNNFLKNGTDVYKGYSDDPRNTDNAWVEIVVKHFHDQTGEQVSAFPLEAGENFADVSWADFSGDWVNVISHQKPVFQQVAEQMGAHWDYTEMWKTHNKCRNATYANNNMTIHRLTVPDGYIHWNVTWLEYTPPMYTADFVYQALWSDPDLNKTDFRPLWNDIDGPLNRKSYVKIYDVNNLYPINPVGRTGLRGRGFLGRWGPNHVTDSVVTRWKRNNTKLVYHELTNKPILQFIAIQKKHIKEWYLPGGFVNPGENILTSLKREFLEETMNILKKKSTEAEKLNKQIQEFFINGKEVYKGYIDDARNTDNAWVEMTAVHFHDKTGEFVNKFVLEAGDDACNVAWLDINKSISLPKATYYIIHSISVEYDSHW